MEFLRVGDKKLKVTLNAEECASYGIDTAEGDPSGARIRRAVREILKAAEGECGYAVDGERILVELYPLPDGRCELLVAKLDSLGARERSLIASAEGMRLMETRRSTYRFADFTDLSRAIRAVREREVRADLYRDDLGRYYIHAREELTDGICELLPFIEFGERLGSLPIPVVAEYGTLLAKDDAFAFVLNSMDK